MTIYRCDMICKKGSACYFLEPSEDKIKNNRARICNHTLREIWENLKDNNTGEFIHQNSEW